MANAVAAHIISRLDVQFSMYCIMCMNFYSFNVTTCSPTINFLSKDDKLSNSGILKAFGTLCHVNCVDLSELESVKVCLGSRLLKSKYRRKSDEKTSHTCNSAVVKPQDNQTSDDCDINRQSNTTRVCTSEEQDLLTKHDDLLSSENISLNTIESKRAICTRDCENVLLNLHKYIEDLTTVKGNQ